MSSQIKIATNQGLRAIPNSIYLWVWLAVGIILRLFQLGSRPMWYDEAIAVLVGRSGIDGIIRSSLSTTAGVSANVHPPLYFSALWVWMEMFGESPFAVRLLSVVLSALVMLVLWTFTKALINPRAALFAVSLYALSPFQVHYGQEARMYVMMSLFLLLATWALWRVLSRGEALDWVLLGISSALAVYTQALAVVYLVCLYLIPPLFRRWGRLKEVVFAGLLALVIYAPWLLQLPAQLNNVRSGYWVQRPGIAELIQTALTFNTGLPLSNLWLPVGLALTVLLFVMLAWRSYAILRENPASRHKLSVILLLAFAPVLTIFLISQIWPVYVIRGLLTSGIVYLLWVALVLEEPLLRSFDRGVILSIVVLSFSIGLLNHYQYRGFPYAPFPEINQYLAAEIEADAVVVHSNKLTMLPAHYYNPELPHTFIKDLPESGGDTLAAATQEVIGIRAQPDIRDAVSDHEQVFLVIFNREIEEYEQNGFELHPALEYLWGQYEEVSSAPFGDVSVYHFQDPGS